MTTHSWTQNGRLGRRGNDGLSDYLLPIIKLMNGGMSHIDAFKRIANRLNVTKNTARDRCTRGLGGLNMDGFVKLVRNGRIAQWLKGRHPDRHDEIARALEN